MSEDDFAKLRQFFPKDVLDPENTEKALRHFQELLRKAKHGSPQEQEEAKAQLKEYEQSARSIRSNLANQMGKSEEDVRSMITNQQNFSQEEWERINEATEEMKPVIDEAQGGSKKKKKKGSKKRQNWMKS